MLLCSTIIIIIMQLLTHHMSVSKMTKSQAFNIQLNRQLVTSDPVGRKIRKLKGIASFILVVNTSTKTNSVKALKEP